MDDDILLPTPPDDLTSYDSDESNEIEDTNDLQVQSQIPVTINVTPKAIVEEDFNFLTMHDLEKTLLQAELADTSMYLKNIHKGFRFARSTRSLINLVGAGLAVHKHRRNVIKEIKESKKDPFEMDEYGNLKS